MTFPLLATKLHIPSLRPGLLSRPRLLTCLKAGMHRSLILVSAPAGYGKTTLLGEWIETLTLDPFSIECMGEGPGMATLAAGVGQEIRVGWLALDDGDNDSVRLLTYLVTAQQRVESGIGRSVQEMLQAPQPPPNTCNVILS
jgi:LuxR family maltose regulon positive regulatory protein